LENKIKNIFEITKLNIKLKEMKLERNDLYRQLGKLVYSKEKNKDENYEKQKQKICNSILYLTNEIKCLNKKVNSVQNNPKTENKLEKEEKKEKKVYVRPEKAPEPTINEEGFSLYKFCPKCQTGNNPQAKVCVYCGEKF